jgi:hypothetical protein
MAVGTPFSGHRLGLALRWNGSRWTALRTPKMPGTFRGQLYDVSCVSASVCLAVGERIPTHSRPPTTLAETWNGRRWSATKTPALPTSGRTSLEHVSCATADACAAVGPNVINREVLIEWWDGARWALSPTPPVTDASTSLADVSCVSNPSIASTGPPVWCEAVGSTNNGLVAMSYH